tara:strand:+ start:5539 stop:5757 length:219 start_codon:yes stop_codon:yes gene_type:complete
MINLEKELTEFFEDYEESKKNGLRYMIEEFSSLNTKHNGFETFQIKPIKNKNNTVIITDIKCNNKSTGKNLF